MKESTPVTGRRTLAPLSAPWESSLRPTPGQVEGALLTYLRKQLGDESIELARPLELAGDGVGARIFSFSLAGAPPEYCVPLVLRLSLAQVGAVGRDRTLVESGVQNALANLGAPVPRVLLAGDPTDGLGGSFLVMEQVDGWNLLHALGAGVAVALGLSVLGVGAGLLVLAYFGLYLGAMLPVLLRLHDLPTDEFLDELNEQGISSDLVSLDDELAGLAEVIEGRELAGLRPVLDWLREHRPDDGQSPVVCHGDYWPGNLMVTRRGRLALIDWTHARVAQREFDLAWLKVEPCSGLPFELPGPHWLQDGAEWLMRSFAWLAVGATRRVYQFFRPLDAQAMRYFEVLHCLRMLAYAEEGRAFARERGDLPPFNPWDSPDTVSLLERSIRRITSLQIELPSDS